MQTCQPVQVPDWSTDISFGRAILRQVEQLAQNQASAPDSIEVTVPFSAGLLILNQLRQDVVAMGSLGLSRHHYTGRTYKCSPVPHRPAQQWPRSGDGRRDQ